MTLLPAIEPFSPPRGVRFLGREAPTSSTAAEVDLDALRHNVDVLRTRAGRGDLIAVLKADAYGHGAVHVARALQEEGLRHAAVAVVPEGIALREAGWKGSILVFAAPLPDYLPAYHRYDLDLTVTSPAVADAVLAADEPLRIHLNVETGMHRAALPPEDAPAVLRRLDAAPHVTVAGVWTHLAAAEDDAAYTETQLRCFRETLAALAPLPPTAAVHAANTPALLAVRYAVAELAPEAPLLARAGLGLYGMGPDAALAEAAGLRPLLRLVSRVTHLQTLDAGDSVSYGRRWTAPHRTRIATVDAGYGDGYTRLLSNRAEVGIGGRRYPVAGSVCMDMFMVDLGPPGGPGDAVQVGDEVVLMGTGGPSVYEVARWSETIPYEATTRIAARVPRRYL